MGDTIRFSTTGTILLTSGSITIGGNLSIIGPGSDHLTIDGNNTDRIFNVTGSLNLSDVTIAHGHPASGNGGAILASGALTVSYCVLDSNQTSGYGGAIYASGSAEIDLAIISRNTADRGGGIYYVGSSHTAILGSTNITGNYAYSGGGGFYNSSGTSHLFGAEVTNNHSDAGGGGIINESGATISIYGLAYIYNNTAGDSAYGGGLLNKGSAEVVDTWVMSNSAGISSGFGGGIGNGLGGTTSIYHSDVMSNTAAGSGAGIFNDTGSEVDIDYSTLAYNVANNTAGGILNHSGVVNIQNSTVSGNQAWGVFNYGAAIKNEGTAATWLNSATIVYNIGGGNGGIEIGSSSVMTIHNTIIAGNVGAVAADCHGTFNSAGYNLIYDFTACTPSGDTTGNIGWVDPKLEPLQEYSWGLGWTHALLPTSIAIDHGDPVSCPAYDQRYVHRPIDGNHDGVATCDIGAYERQIYVYLPLIYKNS